MAVRRLRGDKVFRPSNAWRGRWDIISYRSRTMRVGLPGLSGKRAGQPDDKPSDPKSPSDFLKH
jgi:hypothetical protein